MIFVGYGISAPEQGWDDYKGIDGKGKILVMMVNDPMPTAAEPDRFGPPGQTSTRCARPPKARPSSRSRSPPG